MSTPALTVAYVVKGFLSRIDSSSDGWAAVAHHDGEMGLIQEVCDYADMVEEAWSDDLPEKGWAGVWDYEVSEVVGQWIGSYLHSHSEWPDQSAVRALINSLVAKGMI